MATKDRPEPLYKMLSSLLHSIADCQASGIKEWQDRHEDSLKQLVDFLPSGSGIDSGTKLLDESEPEKLMFQCDFHHMNDGGMYDGWTEHTLTVRPSLCYGIDLRFSGRNRNDIKEYLAEVYQHALTQMVWQDADGRWYSVELEQAREAYRKGVEAGPIV